QKTLFGRVVRRERSVPTDARLGIDFPLTVILPICAAHEAETAVVGGIDDHSIAGRETANVFTDGDHFPCRLVAQDHRFSGGVRAGHDADVGPADARGVDTYENI